MRLLKEDYERIEQLSYETCLMIEAYKIDTSNIERGKGFQCREKLDPSFVRLFSKRDPIVAKDFNRALQRLSAKKGSIFNTILTYLYKLGKIVGVLSGDFYNVIATALKMVENTLMPGGVLICRILTELSKIIGETYEGFRQENNEKVGRGIKKSNIDFLKKLINAIEYAEGVAVKSYLNQLKSKTNKRNPAGVIDNASKSINYLNKLSLNGKLYFLVFMPQSSLKVANGKNFVVALNHNEIRMCKEKMFELDTRKNRFGNLSFSEIATMFPRNLNLGRASETRIANVIESLNPGEHYEDDVDGKNKFVNDLRYGFDDLKNLGILR